MSDEEYTKERSDEVPQSPSMAAAFEPHRYVWVNASDAQMISLRSKAPAASVAPEESDAIKRQIDGSETGAPAIAKRSFSKKSSTLIEIAHETIELGTIKSTTRISSPTPIPTAQTFPSDIDIKKEKEPETDIKTRQPKKSSEKSEKESLEVVATIPEKDLAWSDAEEAGGLPPRTESRLSRAIQQLFCCGRPVQEASEMNIPGRDGRRPAKLMKRNKFYYGKNIAGANK